MAGVDALLNLVVAQGAEALTLAAGRIPALVKSGERRDLSMPPLEPVLLDRFLQEVEESSVGGVYALDGKSGSVRFRVETGPGPTLELSRQDGTSTAPKPQASPHDDIAAAELRGGDLDASALEALVARAIEAEAIDLFLSTGSDARLRTGRELESLPDTRCSREQILELAALDDEQTGRLTTHGSVDFSLSLAAGRVRVNVFQHADGLAAVVRPIQRRIRSLEELGLPSDLRALSEYADGLVLLVGPTGSGKSSTLAALIEHLNQTRALHVVTLEDPIEFQYAPERCLIHQRELGRHVESFDAGLRAALREGPDVILVGEMRDPATIAAALTAAETGHLVLSTLHSGNAAMAIDRILDSFPAHQQTQVRWQLASVLRAIVTQVLLPGVEPGRLVPALEKMVVTHAVSATIRDGRGHQIGSQIQTGRDEGMISLELSLADLTRRGLISRETAAKAARNADLLRQLLL